MSSTTALVTGRTMAGRLRAVAERHPKAAVIVPPGTTAVAGETTASQRDKHLTTIAAHGRMSWQRSSGYNSRSLVETTMFRYKTVIGRRLHARTLCPINGPRQK